MSDTIEGRYLGRYSDRTTERYSERVSDAESREQRVEGREQRVETSATATFPVVAPITKSKIVELVDVREPRRLGLELAR